MNVDPSVNQRQSSSSITVSSTARGAAKRVIEIDLLLTETVQQRQLCGCLTDYGSTVDNCWHIWQRIDTA